MIPLIRPCIWVNEDFLKKIFSELRTSAYQILVNARHHPKEPHQTEETLITAEVQLDNVLVSSGDKASPRSIFYSRNKPTLFLSSSQSSYSYCNS